MRDEYERLDLFTAAALSGLLADPRNESNPIVIANAAVEIGRITMDAVNRNIAERRAADQRRVTNMPLMPRKGVMRDTGT